MRNLYPLIALTEARVSVARGERERALEQLARAEQIASAMQMRPMVWQARAEAARVLSELGRVAEAEQKRREAQAMIDQIAGLFTDEKLRAMYLESASQKTSLK